MTDPSTPYLAQIFPDHWQVGSKEEPLAFETAGLAKTLAQLAWNPENKTPFTVDVRGGWGRGKTTLLRETERLLGEDIERPENSRRVKTLWVNVWKYPSEDTVLAGLLGALLEKFKTDDWQEQLTGLVNAHKGTLAWSVLKMAAPWLPEKLPQLLKADPVQGVSDAISRKRAFHDEFEPLFCHLAHLYLFKKDVFKATVDKSCRVLWEEESKHGVLAIFLDDLDRCNEERVMQVLEAINLFLDMPGVCFFLGIDYDRLKEILEHKLQHRAEAFMEKIIQISLPLPEVSGAGALEYLKSLVAGNEWLYQVINDDVEKVAEMLESRHPRHIKRFLNDLSMRLAILQNTEKLGEASPQIPEQAVLAWHLLHEGMPEEAKNAGKLAANLDTFLRKWKSNEQLLDDENKRKDISIQELRHHEKGILDKYVTILTQLDREQRETLLHLASPGEEGASSSEMSGGQTTVFVEWIDIATGIFKMGSEKYLDSKPIHNVKIMHPFHVAKYPVTNRQYQGYLAAVGSDRYPKYWVEGKIPQGKEKHPVVYISWDDAIEYCQWLTERLGINDKTVRLPTEAEWEYVAAGSGEKPRKYPWGDVEPDNERANYQSNEGDTTEVDGYPSGATPDGVFDMSGNVWEWTLSQYKEYKYRDDDGRNSLEGISPRVIRGGSFGDDAVILRCASRGRYRPNDRGNDIGFRVVLSPFISSDF